MNERIDLLAQRATDSKGGLDRHKFAELIAQEFISICNKEIEAYTDFKQASDDFTEKNIYAEGIIALSGLKYKVKNMFNC